MSAGINPIIVFAALLLCTLAQSNRYTMNLTCSTCPPQLGTGSCVSLNGGPFNAQPFTVSSSCAEVLNYIEA